MVLFHIHPWLRLSTGLLVGCWIGAFGGCAITMLFAGKRLHQLQCANVLLRMKLRTREKTERPGPILVTPPIGGNRGAGGPLRAAGGR
jgi:hypothetical protein